MTMRHFCQNIADRGASAEPGSDAHSLQGLLRSAPERHSTKREQLNLTNTPLTIAKTHS